MNYQVIAGKVQTRALELHVVDHCNLRCDHCCSFSPILPKWFAEPSAFACDLDMVQQFVTPRIVKIVGGEPLLHPELEQLLACAREKAVASHLQLTSNGFLIKRLSSRAWQCLDVLTISLYPQPTLPKTLIREIARKAASQNVKVSWKVQDKFTCLDRKERAVYDDAKSTFDQCWIRHRCHSVKAGRFYCCTRPQYIQKFASDPTSFLQDGVALQQLSPASSADYLKSYLEATEPLHSCYLCRGGHAPLETNYQLTSSEVQTKREQLTHISMPA